MEPTDLIDELPDDFDLGDLDMDLNVDDVSLDPIRVPNGIYRCFLTSIYTNTGKKNDNPWASSSIGVVPNQRLDSTEDVPYNPDPVYDLVWHPTPGKEMGIGGKRKWKQIFNALGFKKQGYRMFKELADGFKYDPDNQIAVVVEIGLKNGENFVKRWGNPVG